jgi:hypothetical protein
MATGKQTFFLLLLLHLAPQQRAHKTRTQVTQWTKKYLPAANNELNATCADEFLLTKMLRLLLRLFLSFLAFLSQLPTATRNAVQEKGEGLPSTRRSRPSLNGDP